MPRFLAVYTMKPEDHARLRALPKAEQDAGLAKASAASSRIRPGRGAVHPRSGAGACRQMHAWLR